MDDRIIEVLEECLNVVVNDEELLDEIREILDYLYGN
jgi:hypothetical protein